MNLRNLSRPDLAPLQSILEACAVFTPAEITCAMELLEIVLNDPQQSDYEVIVAESGGRVAGYVLFGPVPLTEGNYDLYWIATDPGQQGRGIGRTLLAEVERILISRATRMLCLETSSQEIYQRTRNFYLNAGYLEEARICDFYRLGDDRITYVKRFSSH